MNNNSTKLKDLNLLKNKFNKCNACSLAKFCRTKIVFGEGSPEARLMIIGEAPGKEEDLSGKPFIGRSGKLLDKILISLGEKRENIFIANVVKCRPPKNRLPLKKEIDTCKKNLLLKQISIIKPKIICTLGACSTEAILEKKVAITKVRGILIEKNDVIVLPTLHPAYILRQPSALEKLTSDIKLAITLSNQ